jgi:hypothetical protein
VKYDEIYDDFNPLNLVHLIVNSDTRLQRFSADSIQEQSLFLTGNISEIFLKSPTNTTFAKNNPSMGIESNRISNISEGDSLDTLSVESLCFACTPPN